MLLSRFSQLVPIPETRIEDGATKAYSLNRRAVSYHSVCDNSRNFFTDLNIL